MKNKLFLYSLTSLAVTASSFAYAETGQNVFVPTLEGGVTASVGTFYVTPTSDFQNFIGTYTGNDPYFLSAETVNPGYQFGIDASLGYIFEDTANSIELFFRNVSTSDTGSATGYTETLEEDGYFLGDLGYELDSFDLMFSQFVDLGQVMQVRFSGGLAYVELERNEHVDFTPTDVNETSQIENASSKFQGWGPRVGIDTRYGFTNIEGLGIVGGGSMAYYLGDMDVSTFVDSNFETDYANNNPGNHAILNFRANLGLDYVYFFNNDEKSTLGLEVGYLIDYYDDAAAATNLDGAYDGDYYGQATETTSVSFAGPYVNLKGVF